MAMLMIPSKVSSHVRFLLMEFNDSDYHSLAQEICEFFDYGVETSICVLKTCFTFWKEGHTNRLQIENVVSLVLKRVLEMPYFATLLSCALQGFEGFEVTPEFVTAFHSDASTSDSFLTVLKHLDSFSCRFYPAISLKSEIVSFSSKNLVSFMQIFCHQSRSILNCVGDLIEELGYGFTSDASLCKEILSLFLPLTEAAISRILVVVVRTYAGLKDNYDAFLTFSSSLGCCTPTELHTPKSWNVDILFETIKQLAPGTIWPTVIENLDHEGFDIPNMEAFLFFMMVVRNICKDPFPLHAICSFVWKNMEGQLSFLKHAVLAPPEIFTFVHSTRKLLPMDIDEQLALSNHAWRSLDLLDVLCQLAESGHAVSVRSLLQYPLVHCPRTLLLGMTHIETACNIIQREVVSDLLPLMIKNTQDIGFVLNLWQLNREFVIWGLLDAQNLGPDSMLRIIDIFHELKILSSVINSVPLSLGIKLAILASQRGFLEIESWLSKCIFLYKDVLFEECLKVIKDIHFQKSKDIFSKQFRSTDLMSDLCLDATSFLLNVSFPSWFHTYVRFFYFLIKCDVVQALKPHTNVITSRQLFEELEKVHEAVLNIGTFVAAAERKDNPIEAPPSEVQDKIYFIMNNVSAANVESKGKEFSEILSIQYYPWFAQYMVIKRVSTEQQFHDLYLKFLDKVNSQQLYKEIVQASYENCKVTFSKVCCAVFILLGHQSLITFLFQVLLGSALIKSDSEERSLLKNLGSWLGKVTIGRNRVLRACEIDPKSLIIDAYEKGLLIAILPFTAKVLESCQSSIAYQPPNPWTMPILGLLSEIYSMPNLKMNLKFEIEIFFKNIGVNIKSVKPTSLLKNRNREIDGNPDFRNKDVGMAQGSRPQMIDEFKSENISPQNHVELPTNAGIHYAGVHSKLLPQATMLFSEWCQICSHPGENDASRTRHVLHLYQSGLLKGDDKTESFFRILTEYSIAHCISSRETNSGALQSTQEVLEPSFIAIDIYAKLVFSILDYFREQEFSCKSFLLSKIVTVIVRSILKDADDEKTPLYPRPYFRLFINLLLDLSSWDHITDSENYQQVLVVFANAFHALQPLKIPAFSLAWLELVSHRSFMLKLLSLNGQKGWPYAQHLLVGLLQFLEPFLRSAELSGPVYLLYKGTLEVLLMLLHEYPEFLCGYHFTFCNVIPPSCVQMRNIILGAYPRNMRVPDPSTPNLMIVEAPCILSEIDALLKQKRMKSHLDEYLSMRQHDFSFLNGLKHNLLFRNSEADSAGTRYNVPLVNALVLYVGLQAIQQLQADVSESRSNAHTAAMQMFKALSCELDAEGLYLLLSAIANQLGHPNRHTHYFSYIMLYLFFESDQEIIKEQVTRVLLERLTVKGPHPWGLVFTVTELTKNPRYGFREQGFIRCAPGIEEVFESVASSEAGVNT
ncbi:unnamed protein product [Brassica napus]|uniref:(rape) hypothetical protein n=1 Tax=Brassica napus TaxID=3708 RepID=A0A816IQP3_BRANA|nr:unnamed protein product [Brassica napus]